MELAFSEEYREEAPKDLVEGTESLVAKHRIESPARDERLIEEVGERENCQRALARVKANKGSAGVDRMTVQQLPEFTYKPQPVKRVAIAKPDGGGRKFGIPTVLDRFIQQAVMPVLQRRWDRTYSEHSYGFRPGRSAHPAVEQAQRYLAEGYRRVVDLGLEKFFDRVNHDRSTTTDRWMGKIAQPGERSVNAQAHSGSSHGWGDGGRVSQAGLVSPVDEGTPQGGPLSPLRSNLVLEEWDRELERRGLRFARYADDCNIYVRSRRAGERVMACVTRLLAGKLKLTVNQHQSAVARPWERRFLGFSFTWHRQPERRMAPQALARFKERVRELTSRARGVSIERMAEELSRYLRGWLGYFGRCQTPSVLRGLEEWTRRRLRSAHWKQWKRSRVRFAELRRRGVGVELAAQTVGSSHGPWRIANSPALALALSNAYFNALGIPSLTGG
jgi:RNA-directed DNA polymerase